MGITVKIGVIGAGSVGSALAQAWSSVGHSVTFGARDSSKPEVVELAKSIGITVESPADAVVGADVIVLAVPSDSAVNAFRSLGNLKNQIVIDVTNPVRYSDGVLQFSQKDGLSVAEQLALVANNTRIVKTLNQIGAGMMTARTKSSNKPLMFIAGDDEIANQTVATLVSDLDFNPLLAGPLSKAIHLEHLAMLWLDQAFQGGLGPQWGFAVVKNE